MISPHLPPVVYFSCMPPRDVAIGLLVDGDCVLVALRRPEGPFGGFWEFPGGKVEPGESPRAAVVRELREELGVSVTVVEPLGPFEHTYPSGPFRFHPFICRLTEGEPAPLAGVEVRWQRPDDLDPHRFPAASLRLIEALRARVQPRARVDLPAAATYIRDDRQGD